MVGDPIGFGGDEYIWVRRGYCYNAIDSLGLKGFYWQRPLGNFLRRNVSGLPFLNYQFVGITDS